jgi:muconolactone delta-isomerase
MLLHNRMPVSLPDDLDHARPAELPDEDKAPFPVAAEGTWLHLWRWPPCSV